MKRQKRQGYNGYCLVSMLARLHKHEEISIKLGHVLVALQAAPVPPPYRLCHCS